MRILSVVQKDTSSSSGYQNICLCKIESECVVISSELHKKFCTCIYCSLKAVDQVEYWVEDRVKDDQCFGDLRMGVLS